MSENEAVSSHIARITKSTASPRVSTLRFRDMLRFITILFPQISSALFSIESNNFGRSGDFAGLGQEIIDVLSYYYIERE